MASSTERGLGPFSIIQLTISGTSRAILDSVLEPYCSPRVVLVEHPSAATLGRFACRPLPVLAEIETRCRIYGRQKFERIKLFSAHVYFLKHEADSFARVLLV